MTTMMTTMSMMTLESPLGALRLFAAGDQLLGIYLPTQAIALAAPELRTRVLELAAAQLTEYFARERTSFDLPLAPRGTAFQHLVWQQLARIPFGETRSYGAIAQAIGRPAASRAVGAANGRNPLSIVVPCHRVVGASGDLTGYAGGMHAKHWLLAHERRATGAEVGAC